MSVHDSIAGGMASGPEAAAAIPSQEGLFRDVGAIDSRSERQVMIRWPDGRESQERVGREWLVAAQSAGQLIPTGCLGGSCGACEIEVNGQVVRACIATVPACRQGLLRVELASDPFW